MIFKFLVGMSNSNKKTRKEGVQLKTKSQLLSKL